MPDWQFPDGYFSTRTVTRLDNHSMNIYPTDRYPTDTSPSGHQPERTITPLFDSKKNIYDYVVTKWMIAYGKTDQYRPNIPFTSRITEIRDPALKLIFLLWKQSVFTREGKNPSARLLSYRRNTSPVLVKCMVVVSGIICHHRQLFQGNLCLLTSRRIVSIGLMSARAMSVGYLSVE